MEVSATWWIALVVGALAAGLASVGVLVMKRSAEPIAATLGLAGFGMSTYAFGMISRLYGRPDSSLYAFAFMLAALGGGWALASSLLLSLARPLAPPHPGAADVAAVPGPAVILCSCIEPPHYDPRATAGMLRSLTEEELLEVSLGSLPLLFFAHKARYRSVPGGSPSAGQLARMCELLETALGAIDAHVDWATCSGERRLATRITEAYRRGHRTIVIAELAVAPSVHLEAARAEVDDLRLASLGANVVRSGPVVDSDRILTMLVNRVLDASHRPDRAGVVLVGNGQPEERMKRNPRFSELEIVFLNRLRMLIAERGIREEHVRVAWCEWIEPDVTSEVRHLAALGCEQVIVVPATFPLDSLATRLDLEHAALRARVDDTVPVVVLPAWGPDTAVVDELRARVVAALREAAATR